MDIFPQRKDLSALHQEIDGLQKYLTRLQADKEVLVEDLKCYESPEYEHFKTRVLTKEKVRIALLRMTVAASEEYLHERLQGQFNEVELLERNKEKIESDIAVVTRKISDTVAKIEKLKKELMAKTERK